MIGAINPIEGKIIPIPDTKTINEKHGYEVTGENLEKDGTVVLHTGDSDGEFKSEGHAESDPDANIDEDRIIVTGRLPSYRDRCTYISDILQVWMQLNTW